MLSWRKTWKCNKAKSSAGRYYLPKEVVNQVGKLQNRIEEEEMWGKYPEIFCADIQAQSMAAEDVCVYERKFFPK